MTERAALAALLPAFAGRPVLCVGDVMLDRFVYGAVDRVSQEAPIPVLRVARTHTMLGGAGNVARNLAALGTDCRFLTVVGDDAAGREIAGLLDGEDGLRADLIVQHGRRTTIKTRYLAAGQQLLRADDEDADDIDRPSSQDLMAAAERLLPDCAALALSDYGKGVLTEPVTRALIDAARGAGKPVVIDPKHADPARYRGADVLKPNLVELARLTRRDPVSDDEIADAAGALAQTHEIGAVLVTRGGGGVTLAVRGGGATHIAAAAREVFDVSGAGDTVLAVLTAARAAGVPLGDAMALANVAGGIVVGKVGTAVVSAGEIADALREQDLLGGGDKVVDCRRALELVAGWRAEGQTIGFTNGCFDLLHPGHVSLLDQTRAAADRVVVGLNSDASVRRLKGDGRPIQGEAARAAVLASLAAVDLVVIFAEDTPLDLIAAIAPDVLAKGADYTEAQVVGADVVRRNGGRVLLADLTPGVSTTATIERMAK